jgi:hypothetical protein
MMGACRAADEQQADRRTTCIGCGQLRVCDNLLLTLCDECYIGPNIGNPQPAPQQPWTAEQVREYERRQAQGEGVARAVANLNQHEHRLGSSRWVP